MIIEDSWRWFLKLYIVMPLHDRNRIRFVKLKYTNAFSTAMVSGILTENKHLVLLKL